MNAARRVIIEHVERYWCPRGAERRPAFMIWDLHCHLGGFGGKTPDERIAPLIEFADRLGIERVCLYMGQSHGPLRPDARGLPPHRTIRYSRLSRTGIIGPSDSFTSRRGTSSSA